MKKNNSNLLLYGLIIGGLIGAGLTIYYGSRYIIKNNKRKALIIFQSDHGVRYISTAGSNDWQDIFNSYYMPDEELKKQLYDSISSINSYRLIFNYYFNAGLPLLKDPE